MKKIRTFENDNNIREELKEEYLNLIHKYNGVLSKKRWNDHYFNQKIEENSILVCGLGTNVRGSMQYILNELNHNEKYEGFHIYIRARKGITDSVVEEYIRQNHWDRSTVLAKGYSKKLETCQYLITESYYPYNWVKKPGQILIDIWHGTPLKKLGISINGRKRHCQSLPQKNFLCADYLLYPNEFTRDVMWGSYGITPLLHAKGLMLGYPRTAGLMNVTEERKDTLRKMLAPEGEHIYAYMPTFRAYLTDEEAVARETTILKALDQGLGEDQILYANLHHSIGQALDFDQFDHIRAFPPLVDSYELLTATEALITDYSSVMFDYLILRKQIILHIEDYEKYAQNQGLNMDIKELPFDLARSPEEINNLLRRGKQYDDTEAVGKFCKYDTRDSAARLCQLFLGDESGLEIIDLPGSSKKRVLFYTESCACAEATQMLDELIQTDSAEYEFYIGCDEDKTEKNLDGAYPMLEHAPVIGSRDSAPLSSIGETVRDLYLQGKIPFEKAIAFLEHEYALIPIRMYDQVTFDTLVIYDVQNPEVLIGLAMSKAKNKLLFVNSAMAQQLRQGDTFLRDAIVYAADYCSRVLVAPDAAKDVKQILHWRERFRIRKIREAKDLLRIISR